ncbi:MAG: Ubiquinol-cytochrome reductase, cytochrome subunit [Pseudomonadota bacterium]|nr:Ubiquinol-cytochrome reductase, cytochrome subunit [Pseudomonadota bacterium]
MKKLLIALCMLPGMVLASSGGHLDHVAIDLSDKESLKRGAQTFVNYCLSCHGADYVRYNRIGRDLGMSDEEVTAMISTRDAKGDPSKPGELMKVAMNNDYAKTAFGTKIPGLSVIARARGADWLYTYLRTFYVDESRPTGVNNIAFPDVGMPHVLWELQGLQKAKFVTETDADGNEQKIFEGMELVVPGKMKPEEYDAYVADLVNFMVYMGEPMQMERKSLGVWVLLFLFVFTVIAYLLKKEYWKDVH